MEAYKIWKCKQSVSILVGMMKNVELGIYIKVCIGIRGDMASYNKCHVMILDSHSN